MIKSRNQNISQIRKSITSNSLMLFIDEHIQPNYEKYSEVQICKDGPSHLQFQQIIIISIMDKLSIQYSAKKQPAIIDKLREIISKYRQNVSNLSTLSLDQIKKQEQFFICCIQRRNTTKPKKLINYFKYLGYLVLSICNKKQQKILFLHSQARYTKQDYSKLGEQFGYPIIYIDYDDKKMIPNFKDVCSKHISILKMKDKYYLLYSNKKDLNAIKQIEGQSIINQSNIARIFKTETSPKNKEQIQVQKADNVQQQGFLDKIVSFFPGKQNSQKNDSQIIKASNHPSSIIQNANPDQANQKSLTSSFLYVHEIPCSICHKKQKQYDCINWNYEYFCGNCILDPHINTSDIPPQNIYKYCRQRNISFKNYQVPCPQCQGITILRGYDVGKKPKYYRCDTCTKRICLEHNGNIYNCFCICASCSTQTIYIHRMNVNFCLRCNKRHCFNCGKQDFKFCKCICSYCLGMDSEKHECEKQCHKCHGMTNKLRQCRCGLLICYSCYYYQVENQNFQCHIQEYD